jgi:hypothetical protein
MTSVDVVAYRVTSYDVPLWVVPNRREGRWNVPGGGPAQYMCLDAEAPWAEMLRAEDLRTEAEAATFRSVLWQLRVSQGAIADYRSFASARAAGFPPEALVDDDHDRCQAEALRLAGLGARGVLSPSAALPGSVDLTLFGPRAPIAWTTVVSLASSIPAQRLAAGAPPPGLTTRVRYHGEPHPLLRAFLANGG